MVESTQCEHLLKYTLSKNLEWYETKYFLEKHDAAWIIDALVYKVMHTSNVSQHC